MELIDSLLSAMHIFTPVQILGPFVMGIENEFQLTRSQLPLKGFLYW